MASPSSSRFLFVRTLKHMAVAMLCGAVAVTAGFETAQAASGAKASAEQQEGKKGKKLSRETLLRRGMEAAPKAIELAGLQYCEPDTAIELGKLPDKSRAYEINCKNDDGWIVIIAADGQSASHTDCVRAKAQGVNCALPGNENTHKMMQPFVTAIGERCNVTDANFRGMNPQDGENFVEIGCEGRNMSFILGAKPDRLRAIDCITAQAMGIPCEMIAEGAVANAQMDIYQGVLNRAGKDSCEVTKGRIIGVSNETGETIYEFACQNRNSSWLIGASSNPENPTRIFDCLSAQTVFSTQCEFSTQEQLYTDYTAFMTANNEPCTVTKAELLGKTGAGLEIREFACQGKPGYMVIMEDDKETAKRIFKCADATNIGGGCRMPENQG